MSAPITRHALELRDRVARLFVDMCEQEKWLHTQRIFSTAIYGWLLLTTLLLLPYYDELWGPHSLAYRAPFDPGRWDHWLTRLSIHPMLANHSWFFIVGQLGALALVFGRVAPRLGAIGVYVFTINLFNRTGQILDGGNNLVQLLTFYFMFMNVSGRELQIASPTLKRIGVAASNAALWMCRVQIVTVYLTAGVLKLNGGLWQKGMALYYILQGEAYTHPLLREAVVAVPELTMFATYGTMAFQILFVVLIWHRPARPYLITAGVCLHFFGIGMGMGLFLFGSVMCVAYLAFLPPSMGERLRAPWIDPSPLRVEVPADQSRLVQGLQWLGRLDWGGRITLEVVCGLQSLRTTDVDRGVQREGVRALLAVLPRIPLMVPLVPLAWLAWYLGLGQRLHRATARAS